MATKKKPAAKKPAHKVEAKKSLKPAAKHPQKTARINNMKTSHHWKESPNEKLFFMNITQSDPNLARYAAKNSHKPVTFFCAAPYAKAVELAGDFNHWQPFPMARSVDGWWMIQVHLSHGHHQYRFLVDGQPMLDPHATGLVRDEHGDRVSLLAVS